MALGWLSHEAEIQVVVSFCFPSLPTFCQRKDFEIPFLQASLFPWMVHFILTGVCYFFRKIFTNSDLRCQWWVVRCLAFCECLFQGFLCRGGGFWEGFLDRSFDDTWMMIVFPIMKYCFLVETHFKLWVLRPLLRWFFSLLCSWRLPFFRLCIGQ